MKSKITVLLGLIFILAGLIWYAATLRESACAEAMAQEIVPQLQQTVLQQQISETEPEPTQLLPEHMTEVFIDGIGYVGVLRISVLDLELPVISFWSAEHAKIAPCRYSGTVYQDDLILCAHNYDGHFGKLQDLENGDVVTFTDADGCDYSYQVQETQVLEGTDVEKIHAGDWDLTLFTCTPGGKMRYCVRCLRSA